MSGSRQIETERPSPRPHTVDDFAEVAAMGRAHEVERFIGGAPASTEDSWVRLRRDAGHWALLAVPTSSYLADGGDSAFDGLGLADSAFERTAP